MSTSLNAHAAAAGAAVGPPLDKGGKYLVFHLGREEYAVPVLKVREIVNHQSPAVVPNAPPYLTGVINLRGKVVPVIDLRLRLSLPQVEATTRTCLIVVQVEAGSVPGIAALVVDDVSEVIQVNNGDIQNLPELWDNGASPFVLGIARTKSGVRILLEADVIVRGFVNWDSPVSKS